jgi:hypothetical protein
LIKLAKIKNIKNTQSQTYINFSSRFSLVILFKSVLFELLPEALVRLDLGPSLFDEMMGFFIGHFELEDHISYQYASTPADSICTVNEYVLLFVQTLIDERVACL